MEKTKLILVPGLLCDALLWRAQLDALADVAEMRVADHTRSATMAEVARDVLADAPYKSFALAGLSMGGYVALEMMRQAPQRVHRLALLDTSARGKFAGVTEALMPQLIHPSRLGDTALTGAIRQMANNVGKEAFVRQQQAIMSRAESRPLLAAIKCPTLVLCGRQDQLTPLDRHEEMAAGIQGAKLEVLEECGHISTMEKPGEVNRALRQWLAGP